MSIAAIQTHYLTKIAAGGCENIGQIYSFLGLLYMADGAKDDDALNVCHLAIKSFIEKNTELCTGPLIDEYLAKFEEYHYEKFQNGKRWMKNNRLHRVTKLDSLTLPAYIGNDGNKMWYVDGKKHRDDKVDGLTLPAEIYTGGRRVWYKNGKKHRDDKVDGLTLPADIWSNGDSHWFIDGKKHREDRGADGLVLPAAIYVNGQKTWILNDVLARNDVDEYGNLLPTEIFNNGALYWNKNGHQHRAELGKNPNDLETFGKALPAIIHPDGNKYWSFENENISCEKLTKMLKKNDEIDCKGTVGVNIVSDDGSVIKLTGAFSLIQLLRN